MDDGSHLSWIIVILLLAGAMFFAFAETAFASVSRTRLKTVADRGDSRGEKALYIKDNMDRAITTILIGTNVTHLATATIVTVEVTRRWGVSAVSISTLVTTLVVFFAGEMLPKSIARKYCERMSLATAGLLRFFMVVLYPIAWVLTAIGNAVAKMSHSENQVTVTEDELYDMITEMKDAGSLDQGQADLIGAALMFGDVAVESVLTSRADLCVVDIDDSPRKILEEVRNKAHSRFPVYEGDVDHIIGILQIRTFIKAYMRQGDDLDVRSILDEAYFIHQSTEIDDLLSVMSRKKLNMAIVMDNFGGTLGAVTVEDILERLVGDIWDEEDTVREEMINLGGGVYDVDVSTPVGDVFEALGIDFDYDDEEDEELVNTLFGQICYEQFRQAPEVGDRFDWRGLEVEVSQMDFNRIRRLHVHALPESQTSLEADGGDE